MLGVAFSCELRNFQFFTAFERAIEKARRFFGLGEGGNPSIIFCQLPDDDASRYNLLKMLSDTRGIQSQMWVKTKFDKGHKRG